MTNIRAKALEALTEWKISRSTGNADLEHEKAKAMSKAVEEAISEPKWKSMESCPKNRGEPIIMIDVEGVIDIGWWNDEFKNRDGYIIETTHWMPLPDAPTGEKS